MERFNASRSMTDQHDPFMSDSDGTDDEAAADRSADPEQRPFDTSSTNGPSLSALLSVAAVQLQQARMDQPNAGAPRFATTMDGRFLPAPIPLRTSPFHLIARLVPDMDSQVVLPANLPSQMASRPANDRTLSVQPTVMQFEHQTDLSRASFAGYGKMGPRRRSNIGVPGPHLTRYRKRSANITDLTFSRFYAPEAPSNLIRVWRNERNMLFYDCQCGKRKAVQDLKKIVKHIEFHCLLNPTSLPIQPLPAILSTSPRASAGQSDPAVHAWAKGQFGSDPVRSDPVEIRSALSLHDLARATRP